MNTSYPLYGHPLGGFFHANFEGEEVNFIAKRENILNLAPPFPDEKSHALTHFLEENREDLECCMVESAEQLYRKTVPAAIRKYIDATLKKQAGEGKKGPKGLMDFEKGEARFKIPASIANVYTSVYTNVYTFATG